MADASPNSARDLEIVEIVDMKEEDLVNDEEKENSEDVLGDSKEANDDASADERAKSDNDKDGKSDDGKDDDGRLKIYTSSSDTNSIRSRVFVGHLNTDKATRRDIDKLFSPCGEIKAISLLRGYGFVQFDNEESALKAIEKLHGTPLMGSKLVVDKPAAWKKLDGENPRDPKPWPKDNRRPYTSEDREDDRHRDRYSRNRRRDYDNRNDDFPSRYRDPQYERYLEMRYMEEKLAERYRYERLYDRYPAPSRYQAAGGDYMGYRGFDRSYDYPPPSRGYDYLRDDDYDRDKRPFDSYGYR